MDVKQRIIKNVKAQGIANGRLEQLSAEAEEVQIELTKLCARMDLLDELLQDGGNPGLNDLVKTDLEFKRLCKVASDEGRAIAAGQSQRTDDPPPPLTVVPAEADEPGTTAHTGNKTVAVPTLEEAAAMSVKPVERSKVMPKIMIDDVPPEPPEAGEDDDDS